MMLFSFILKQHDVYGQDCPMINYPPLPEMYMLRDNGKMLIKEFSDDTNKKSKNSWIKELGIIKNPSESLIYNWKAFNNLAHKVANYDTMRIYFAVYHECNIPSFPKVAANKLILLFSPELPTRSKQKFFFINEKDNRLFEIPDNCAKSWIEYFEIAAQKALRKTVDSTDPDNVDSTVADMYSDTKSISYSKQDFEDAFIKEQVWQTNQHKTPITAIKVDLSAFTSKGRDVKPNEHDQQIYKNRLFLQFNYMRKNVATGVDEPFDLQDQTDDFNCRLTLKLKKIPQFKNQLENMTLNEKLKIYSNDNGLLCPTHCP